MSLDLDGGRNTIRPRAVDLAFFGVGHGRESLEHRIAGRLSEVIHVGWRQILGLDWRQN